MGVFLPFIGCCPRIYEPDTLQKPSGRFPLGKNPPLE
jgi:hypothetical protein